MPPGPAARRRVRRGRRAASSTSLLPEQFAAPQRGPQRVERIGDHRHEVVSRMGQSGVVEDAGVLADAERLPAHLQNQRLPDRVADIVGRGDAEAGVGQPG